MAGDSGGTELESMSVASDDEDDPDLSGSKRKYDGEELLQSLGTLSGKEIQEIIGIAKKRITDRQLSDDKNTADNEGFTLVQNKKHKQNSSKSTSISQNSTPSISTSSNNADYRETIKSTKNINYSPKMNEIINKKYINLFYVNVPPNITTRTQMADVWGIARPSNSDIILKTKKGFLLKSDTSKTVLINTLKVLQKHEKITAFSETSAYTHNNKGRILPEQSYSCVVSSVELEISEATLGEHLNKLGLNFRYCKRIISRSTNLPTRFIRLITGDVKSYEKLLTEGLFFKCRHYAVYTSSPPPPAPLPCNKCLSFEHKSEACKAPLKCLRCGASHSTNKCATNLPPKCNSCGSTEHQAWSFKCPNRPKKPIEGIPNLPVKTLNKKTRQITNQQYKNTRIHAPVTIHDLIVNTYVNKLNKPENVNRQELLDKLRKKFISEFQVETAVTFIGNNWIYILMFDLEVDDLVSPTETTQGSQGVQVRTNV